jgi:predicted HTH domain antitoxin
MKMTNGMIRFETEVPEDIFLTLQASGFFKNDLAQQSRRLLGLRFFQDRVLSLGKAARLSGMKHWEFVDFLVENKTPVINYSEEELAAEFEAVDRLAGDYDQ